MKLRGLGALAGVILGLTRKARIKAEFVLDITVQKVKKAKCDSQYQGRIEGFGAPLKFEVLFNVSLGMLESYVKIGEVFQAPAKKIADVLNQALKGRYDLKIVRKDGKPIGASPEELDAILFQPIAIAIGFLQGKSGVSEATFRIPCLTAEEMSQFRSPEDLQEYIMSLNR